MFIGVAQEKMRAFKAHKRRLAHGGVTFDFTRQSVNVNHYYFYVHDREWGPAFLKLGTYLPYPVKICLNGHEWVKQQLGRAGIAFTSLDNGFLTCADPSRLQTICDQLGPHDLQQFFDRWSQRLPWPLQREDRTAGFDHRITLCQLEISLTQIFDRPRRGREFFEEIIRDNLDLGRPDRVQLIFDRMVTKKTPGRRFPSPPQIEHHFPQGLERSRESRDYIISMIGRHGRGDFPGIILHGLIG